MIFLVTAFPAFAQKVNIDFDKAFDFSTVKTYAWEKGTPARNPLMDERIKKAIDSQLTMKGFQKVDSDPDLYVVYHAATKEKIEITDWGYPRPRWGTRDIDINTVLVGTLVLDMLTGTEKKLIWRAVGSDTVSDDPEKNEKKINKGAEKIFKDFPPSKKQEGGR